MRATPFRLLVRLAGIGLVLWLVAGEVSKESHGQRLTALLLVAAMLPAWVYWTTASDASPVRKIVTFCWLGAAGGALTLQAPIPGLAIVGAGALGAGASFSLPVTLLVSATGPAALLIAALAEMTAPSQILGAAAASLAGIVVGAGRRDSAERGRQQALVAVEREKSEVERARADVLAERNRLAREVHDVLAHTLGALSVQLEALDAPGIPDELRAGIRRTKSLAAEGLADARQAVQALRDDAVPLHDQIVKLCELRNARLSVDGQPRVLAPDVTLALYRVAQESLTNAAKHAPGAAVEARLGFERDAVSLAIENQGCSQPTGTLADSGSGYGLNGLSERVRLLGGEVAFGPQGDGWMVRARLPA